MLAIYGATKKTPNYEFDQRIVLSLPTQDEPPFLTMGWLATWEAKQELRNQSCNPRSDRVAILVVSQDDSTLDFRLVQSAGHENALGAKSNSLSFVLF